MTDQASLGNWILRVGLMNSLPEVAGRAREPREEITIIVYQTHTGWQAPSSAQGYNIHLIVPGFLREIIVPALQMASLRPRESNELSRVDARDPSVPAVRSPRMTLTWLVRTLGSIRYEYDHTLCVGIALCSLQFLEHFLKPPLMR